MEDEQDYSENQENLEEQSNPEPQETPHNIETIKKLFDDAMSTVADLPDIIKPTAFKIAVRKLSGESAAYIQPAPQPIAESRPASEPIIMEGDFYTKMAYEVGVEREELMSIYHMDKSNDIKITATLTGNNADKQRQLAFLYLLANQIGNNEEWTSALEFAKQVNNYGINDGHISHNLKVEKGNILQSGQNRSKKYRLTPNGVSKGKDLLKRFLFK